MAIDKRYLRRLHFTIAPIMVAPLFVTVLTGSLFQVAVLTGHGLQFSWLLGIHRGDFIVVNLEMIYPFLNGLGLLLLLSSGIILWWTGRPRKRKRT